MQTDYIMRMIEQFTQVLAYVVQKRKEGKHDEALQHVQKAARNFLKMDTYSLLLTSVEELIEQLDAEECLMAAELLFEMALIGGEDEVKRKSYALYKEALGSEERFQVPPYLERMSLLEKDFSESVPG